MQIFRVIVRGRFGPLDEQQRAALRRQLDDGGDLDGYRFSPDGTLAYDRRLDFFSVRVEARVEGDATDAARDEAFAAAEALTARQLERRGVSWRDLRTTGTNMADVWN